MNQDLVMMVMMASWRADGQLASSDVVQENVSCHDYFAHQLKDPCVKYGFDWEGAQKKIRSSGRGSIR